MPKNGSSLSGDRIDFVIVATCAIDRQSEKYLPRGSDNIVEAIIIGQRSVGRFVVPLTESVVSRRNDAVCRDFVEFVTGELFTNELRIRFVLVKRANDIITITPHKRLGVIALKTICLRVTHEIEPMPCPAFAVMW